MLQKPLSQAINTTSNHLRRLKELGIETVEGFLLYFPRKHTDSRELRKISEIKIGEINNVQVQIYSIFTRRTKSGKYFTRAIGLDETSSLEIIWFNQPHLQRLLFKKMWIIVSGKAKFNGHKLTMISPKYEPIRKEQIHMARIIPVYHETELHAQTKVRGKISSQWVREKLHDLLPYAEYFEEFLPESLLTEENLLHYPDAIRNIHFPKNEKTLEKARQRLAYNELFLLQLAALQRKYYWRKIATESAKQIPIDWEMTKSFIKELPFQLTNSQKKVLFEILKDLEKPYPMSRLLQGDVGSGKTIVAAIAILNVVKAGFQTCLMAPTEILAKQHYKTLMKFLQPKGLNIQFIAGSTTQSQKEILYKQMKTGTVDLVIGTHALIQENIGFKKLGLAVIDEQHRFGVKQREKLKTFGSPHLLSLSATPIPRTLALTIYGDQDLSTISELPSGRQTVITRIVPENKRHDAYFWVKDKAGKGRQVFVICPLVEDSEFLEVKAATEEFERLKNEVFPDLRLGLLHGKMKPKEKDEIMNQFAGGKIDILVSTAVVEVGIDVPNATIIIIEGAERFGLAQLHQFRGRVGRGLHQSYCFLFPSLESPEILQRLNAIVKYSNGFKLAEIDLRLRGPGEVYGIRQSGIPDLRIASFMDTELIQKTRNAAEKIIKTDPELKFNTKLREKIEKLDNIGVDY